MTISITRILAVALGLALLPAGAAQAHDFGPFPVTQRAEGGSGSASSCRNAHNQVRRAMRRAAREHCQATHDSGQNALRNQRFARGTCTKVKRAGQATVYTITGASYSAVCR